MGPATLEQQALRVRLQRGGGGGVKALRLRGRPRVGGRKGMGGQLGASNAGERHSAVCVRVQSLYALSDIKAHLACAHNLHAASGVRQWHGKQLR